MMRANAFGVGVVFGCLAWAGQALACAGEARADGGLSAIELHGGIGLLGASTTGVGEPLVGYGYDRAPGPMAEGGARFLFGDNEYFRHGLQVRGGYQAGRGFGRRGYGFRFATADLAYVFRTILPCMSDEGRREYYLSAYLGVSGSFADAGTGRGPMNMDVVEREAASRALDHGAVGWVVGTSFDLHLGSFLIGTSFDLRQQFGIDTVAARHFLPSVIVRVGGAFDLLD